MAFLALAATLCSCETAANRRELYTNISANGPWHDYERRREAEAALGTSGAEPASTAGATHQPRSTPLPPGGAPLPAAPAPATAPAPAAPPPPAVPDQAPGAPPAPAASAPAPDASAPAPTTPQ